MFLILGILLAIIAFYFLRFHYDFIRAFVLSLKINGPPAYPLIGNGLLFFNKSAPENFVTVLGLLKEYGDFWRLWTGPELNLIVQDPNDVEILLTSTKIIAKSSEYEFLKNWLNDGLLLSTGKKWHDRRKIITQAFHFNILEKFTETFNRIGNVLIEKLNRYDADESIEFYPITALYALDVICETAMGISVNALSKPNSEYVNAVKKMVYAINTRMYDFLLRKPYFFKYSNLAKTQNDALRVLHSFTDKVIQKRRQELSEHRDESKDEYDEIGVRKKRALLDLLLQSSIDGKPLNDLDIREEVDTFMFEGHDTTTSGITFALYNIAKYADVQRKCLKEIVDVIGTDPKHSTATITQLNQLSYLELVIKESLRLYPPVPIVGRLATDDVELTKNRVVPKGANIYITIYSINRNEKYFDNPDEFIPERFLNENTMEKRNAFTYIPFSAGPRNCIGQKFAMYEMKSVLSKIVHNFDVSLAKESEKSPILSAALILRPESSIRFNFKRRN